MSAIGGSIDSVSIRGRNFPVAADADVGRKLGGFEGEYKPNGNGTARRIMTRVSWMLEGIKLSCDDTRSDHEFLKEIADGQDDVAINITFVSGFTYQGKGSIVGEVKYSSGDATAEVSLSGPGELTQQ